ncbi:hypothetical protein DB346_15435 [Verrucomicrobia bacterium LW23]|nr:hypothetical protein DB346_15435 [Verrucomicrobia bacterium LW23]
MQIFTSFPIARAARAAFGAMCVAVMAVALLAVATGRVFAAEAPAAATPAGPGVDVEQPHLKARITVQSDKIEPGKPFEVALTLTPEAHWHTYWINPGDSGLAPSIEWKLPEGVKAGPLRFPTPHYFTAADAINYGYEAAATFLVTLTADPAKVKAGDALKFEATANWLVCKDICLPGDAAFAFSLTAAGPGEAAPTAETKAQFAGWNDLVPAPLPGWEARAEKPTPTTLRLIFRPESGAALPDLGNVYFYAQTELAVQSSAKQALTREGGAYVLTLERPASAPDLSQVTGLLKAEKPFAPGWNPARAWEMTDVPVTPPKPGFAIGEALIYAGAAFLVGLLLNVMPCVLPVISLKIFSFMDHGGRGAAHAWRHGLAYTLGVLVSFWALGLALALLRAVSPSYKWGFLMQETWFVYLLTVVFLVMGISMFGVFEFGTGLGAAASQASHSSGGGLIGSFGGGVLATAAATPCTAPALTGPILYSLTQPMPVTLAIFTALGLGLAAPYLVLSTFPPLLKYVPRPGEWMESFKQFLGFLLMGSVAFTIFTLSVLVSEPTSMLLVLFSLVGVAMACWVYGRWTSYERTENVRIRGAVVAALIMIVSLGSGFTMIRTAPEEDPASIARVATPGVRAPHEAWYPYTPEAVKELTAAGKPVFIDFTADWCINCKFYEKTVLETAAMKAEFARRGITTFKADFTRRNAVIAKALDRYGAIGVPVYVLYGADSTKPPTIWTDGITTASLTAALEKTPEAVTLKK